MKKRLLYFYFLLFAGINLSFYSCGLRDYSGEINQLDSSLAFLMSSAEQLSQDSMLLRSRIKEIEQLAVLNKKIIGDTVNKEAGKAMLELLSLRKTYIILLKEKNRLLKEAGILQRQLQKLKKDLQHGAYDPQRAQTYIENETASVNKFIKSAGKFSRLRQQQLDRYTIQKEKFERTITAE